MGYVQVHGADMQGDRLETLRVKIMNVPPRTIDRDTAIAWMREGHSLLPIVDGAEAPALQLVEITEGDEVQWFVRNDHQPQPKDALPPLPGVSEARV